MDMMKSYKFRLNHDSGITIIKVIARNEDIARLMIIKAESCPSYAITLIT